MFFHACSVRGAPQPPGSPGLGASAVDSVCRFNVLERVRVAHRARPRPRRSGGLGCCWNRDGSKTGELPRRAALENGLRPWRVVASELRSEEHTSELQSRENLVCRLLLEKK